eukprot:scaffold51292_cov57-Phaeocystis_antarctica.AAC.5
MREAATLYARGCNGTKYVLCLHWLDEADTRSHRFCLADIANAYHMVRDCMLYHRADEAEREQAGDELEAESPEEVGTEEGASPEGGVEGGASPRHRP